MGGWCGGGVGSEGRGKGSESCIFSHINEQGEQKLEYTINESIVEGGGGGGVG